MRERSALLAMSCCAALTAAVLACTGTDHPQPVSDTPEAAAAKVSAGGPSRPPVDSTGKKPEERGDVEGIRRALGAVLDEGAPFDDLAIDMGCLTDQGMRRLAVWGSGITIWNQESQFTLGGPEILGLLESFRRNGFADMRLSYGGKEDPLPTGAEGEPAEEGLAAIQVICRIELNLAGAEKTVIQLLGNRQSAEVRQLADELFAAVREPAAGGVRAATLTEGLQKISSGELAPEAFELLVNRKAEEGADGELAGWLLRVDALDATARNYVGGAGLGQPVALELTSGELAEIADLLASEGAEGLPKNLWSEIYTDMVVRVLNRKVELLARQFAGMSATTHGEKQEQFDRIFGRLAELAEDVLANGEPTEP